MPESALLWTLGLISFAAALTVGEIREYCDALPNQTLVIGMVTKGNTELTLERWRPTFETYLTESLTEYGCRTKLIPLEFDTYESHTANKTIDFIFPNPTAFQEMKTKYGVSEFLSVKRNFGEDQELDRFGGVVVRFAEYYTDIIELVDIRNHPGLTVCAVSAAAFGGWQIQWYEMLKNDVDVMGTLSIDFVGGHEIAIRGAIVDHTCDIAVARTETVERMIELGEFNETDIFTIGELGPALDFPQHLSTVLYPEWPLASLDHIPPEIVQITAIPLLLLTKDSEEAIQGDYAGFAFPYSYEPVRAMLVAIDAEGTGQCDPGYYREGVNPGLCLDCVAGYYSEEGFGDCTPCPIGTVNNGTRNIDCSFCPGDLTTLSPGGVTGECVRAPEEDEVPYVLMLAISGGVLGIIFLGGLLFGVVRAVRMYRQWVQSKKEEQAARLKRVKDAVLVMQNIRYPLAVMRFSRFRTHGALVTHEFARDAGDLLILDTWTEAVTFASTHPIVFNSHQWLGWKHPDPENVHYESIVFASEAVCRKHGHLESELYLWVDLHSIPQKCLDSKLSAIASIAVYACCATYFVVVAPEAIHTDSKLNCNAETYARRGWCRLEQWAFMGICGVEHMYLLESTHQVELVNLSEMSDWMANSSLVFGGDFTVEGDKYALVDVTLGLYGFVLICGEPEEEEPIVTKMLTNQSAQLPSRRTRLQDVVSESNKAKVFPEKYFHGLERLLEQEIELGQTNKSAQGCFSKDDFDNFLVAAQAFEKIQGRSLHHRLVSRTETASSGQELRKLAEESLGGDFFSHTKSNASRSSGGPASTSGTLEHDSVRISATRSQINV